MIEIPVADAADQTLAIIMNGRRCSFRLRFNVTSARWSFDLSIDDNPVIYGRRIVMGRDLLAGLQLGLGVLVVLQIAIGAEPDRASLPNGAVRLYHLTEADVEVLSS